MEKLFILFIILIFFLIVIIYNQLKRNRLIKAQIFLQIEEKLRTDKSIKRIEGILDKTDLKDIVSALEDEELFLDEYLRFFDSLILLGIPNYFSKEESDYLFGRHSVLLRKHSFIMDYIKRKKFNNLETILHLEKNNSLSEN